MNVNAASPVNVMSEMSSGMNAVLHRTKSLESFLVASIYSWDGSKVKKLIYIYI